MTTAGPLVNAGGTGGGGAGGPMAGDVTGTTLSNTVVRLTGAAGVVTLPSLTTIEQQALSAQPTFPILAFANDSAHYAPMGITMSGGGGNGGLFPGADPAIGWGYNQNAQKPLEPTLVDNLEIDFSPGPAQFQVERYIQFNFQDLSGFCRPFGAVMNRVLKTTATGLSWTNAGGTGRCAFAGQESGLQWAFVDNGVQITPASYQVNGGALGWTMSGTMNFDISPGDFSVGGAALGNIQMISQSTWQIALGAAGLFGILGGNEIAFTTNAGANKAFLFTSPSPQFVPNTDNDGSIGTNANRWALVRAVVITSGDLDLHDPEHGAHWTVREEKDGISAYNQVNGKWYKLAMAELSAEEQARYSARPMRKGPVQTPEITPQAKPLPLPERPEPLPPRPPKGQEWEFWKHPFDRTPGSPGYRDRTKVVAVAARQRKAPSHLEWLIEQQAKKERS